jgi:hypothetical protein
MNGTSATTGSTGCSCLVLILTGLIGGWMLQYDLNHWIPILHRAFPAAISDPGPFTTVFPWLFIAGFFLGGPAFLVAVCTFLLSVLGIIS